MADLFDDTAAPTRREPGFSTPQASGDELEALKRAYPTMFGGRPAHEPVDRETQERQQAEAHAILSENTAWHQEAEEMISEQRASSLRRLAQMPSLLHLYNKDGTPKERASDDNDYRARD